VKFDTKISADQLCDRKRSIIKTGKDASRPTSRREAKPGEVHTSSKVC
jgi:hypothetical protein